MNIVPLNLVNQCLDLIHNKKWIFVNIRLRSYSYSLIQMDTLVVAKLSMTEILQSVRPMCVDAHLDLYLQ